MTGEVYEGETLRPSRVALYPASWITSEGVEQVVIIECSGEYQGVPFRFALEFAPEHGLRIGESLVRLSKAEPAPAPEPAPVVRKHDDLGQCLCLGVDECGTSWCVDPEHAR